MGELDGGHWPWRSRCVGCGQRRLMSRPIRRRRSSKWPKCDLCRGRQLRRVSEVTGATINTIIQLSNTSTDPVDRAVLLRERELALHEHRSGLPVQLRTAATPARAAASAGRAGTRPTSACAHAAPAARLAGQLRACRASIRLPPKAFGTFAIDGVTNFGISGSSNAGSRIPPVPEEPFNWRADAASSSMRTASRSIAT